MKKITLLVVAACLAIGSNAYAQFTNTLSSSSSTRANTDGWTTIWAEYNPIRVDISGDDEKASAVSFGISKAFSITSGAPLFLEIGLGMQYTFQSDFADLGNFGMVSTKIPVNFLYSFQIPNSFVIINPFIGLNMRFNITGEWDNTDLFDEDVWGKDNTFKRFQAGWHIGVKARIGEHFMAGVSYGSDFSNIWEYKAYDIEAKVSTTTITLGYTF